MLKSLVATLGFLSVFSLRSCSEVPPVRFRGSFDCKTGSVRFTSGLKKRTFPSLDDAIDTLRSEKFETTDWLRDFKDSLRAVCTSSTTNNNDKGLSTRFRMVSYSDVVTKTASRKPATPIELEISGVAHPYSPFCGNCPPTLIGLKRTGDTVEFRVYEAKRRFSPRGYMDVATQSNGCWKISDTPYCIKCPNGKIYCDIRP
jgi:hypothetical protein